MDNNRNIIRLCFFILVIFISFCCITKEMQNDTFYMIKLGDYIVHHGIDLKDHWCWVANLIYTYPHWLYDVFIYYVYNSLGFNGIYVSTVFSYILLIITFYYVNMKINKNEFLSILFTLIVSFCLLGAATARAQLFSLIIFILEIYYIFKLIDGGKKRYIIILCFLSLLLANIHGTVWLFYFVLFLPFIGEEIFYFFSKKFKFKISDKLIISKNDNFKYLIISFILSFGMGLLSPSRICYSYVFRIMMGDSQKFITEHFPLIVIKYPMFLIFVLILLIFMIFTKAKIKLSELFMILGVMIMSLISMRHLSFFYSIGVMFILIIISRYLNSKKSSKFEILLNKVAQKWYVGFIVIIIAVMIIHSNNNASYVNKKEFPVDAVKYIKENLDYKNIKLFNAYNYGSYLMLNDIPVIIDSRCDLYLNEFNKGVTLFDDILDIKAVSYLKVFDKYEVEYILINKDSIFYELLIRDVGNDIYRDKNFVLFKYK
ncbi:MAG: hypothetical protein IJI49_00575 [Bacilli bacterium]|nr:hypothetical protein [Bacilli bacterium]